MRTLSLAALAALALVAGQASAAEPVRLDKEALEKLLPGKTMSYTNLNGSTAMIYFAPDGSFTYRLTNNRESRGTWTAGDRGFCIKVATGPAQDHCRGIWKGDTGHTLRNAAGEPVAVSGLD